MEHTQELVEQQHGIRYIRKEYKKIPSKPPITSYGVILYSFNEHKQPIYLLAQRRDTIEYIVVLRGKYTKKQLEIYIQLLTIEEQQRILTKPFDDLWNDLWIDHSNVFYKNFYEKSKLKFQTNYDLIKQLILKYPSTIQSTPWGIPKGKKNTNENDITCALREFIEETTIHVDYRNLVPVEPSIETFTGSNHKIYRTIYYIAFTDKPIIPVQKSLNSIRSFTISDETQQVKWCTLQEAHSILPEWRYKLLLKTHNRLFH